MYKIGFPIDGGDVASSAIVLVRLQLAIRHCCKDGQSSGLREKSGAAFVFKRLSSYMIDRYRFEFEMKPHISKNIAPDNIADIGYSDAVACALATMNYKTKENNDSPLVLVSMSFTDNKPESGFSGLFLEKVTVEEKEISKISLRNKWEVSKQQGAIALVLHEEDAQLLREYEDIKVVPFSKNVFVDCREATIVSCKADEFSLLSESLVSNISAKKTKPRSKIIKYIIPVCIAILVAIFVVPRRDHRHRHYHESMVKINVLPQSPQKYQVEIIVEEPMYIYLFTLIKNEHESKHTSSIQEIFPDSSFGWQQKVVKGKYVFPGAKEYFIKNVSAVTPIFCFYSDQPLSKHENYMDIIRSFTRPGDRQFFKIRNNLYLIIFPFGI